ncbi:unnamed protein product, partial [Rotaria socialis]
VIYNFCLASISDVNADTSSLNDSTSINDTNHKDTDESGVIDDKTSGISKVDSEATDQDATNLNNTSATSTQYGM